MDIVAHRCAVIDDAGTGKDYALSSVFPKSHPKKVSICKGFRAVFIFNLLYLVLTLTRPGFTGPKPSQRIPDVLSVRQLRAVVCGWLAAGLTSGKGFGPSLF